MAFLRSNLDGQDVNLVINSMMTNENTKTATGSSRTDAYAMTTANLRFTTVAASTGVVLTAALAGRFRRIWNAGANTLTVYGAGSDTIDGTAGATGVSLPAATNMTFFCLSDGVWISAAAAALGAATATTVVATSTITGAGFINTSIDAAKTAAGTTRADAYSITKNTTQFTTAAASTGAVLPAAVVGARYVVYNAGANAIKVYANGSDTIDGTAGATGVALANAKRCEYFCVAAATWISAQLGVVSA